MQEKHPPFTKTATPRSRRPASRAGASALASDAIPASDLSRLLDSWILAGDISNHSERTMESRRERVSRLLWFLQHRGYDECSLAELREFFHYVRHGHKEPGGRWGNPRMTKPTSPGRIRTYYNTLRTFFRWLVDEGEIDSSPMERIPPPIDRPDEIQPFNPDQLKAMLSAARKSRGNPRRDEAILLLLLDTGIRASELCALTCADIDLHQAHIVVREGKGRKSRVLPFSRDTKRVLYHYLNEREWEADAPLFLSERGRVAGEGLLRNGLLQMIRRIGKGARVEGVRVSPHTFRHTFAIEFLRAGGNVFTLMRLLGHTNLAMTQRYVAIAQADITTQHRMYSPVARLKGRSS